MSNGRQGSCTDSNAGRNAVPMVARPLRGRDALLPDEGQPAAMASNTPHQDRKPLAEPALKCVPLTKLFLR